MFTSVRDRLNYASFLLQKGKFKGKQLLSEKYIDMMMSPQLPVDSIGAKTLTDSRSYGNSNYGFGLFNSDNYYGYKGVFHGGNYLGCTSDFILVPELNLAIVAAANVVSGPRSIVYSALPMLLGKDHNKDVKFIAHRNHLKKLSGIYELYKGPKLEIKNNGGLIYIKDIEESLIGLHPTPLIPETNEPDCLKYYLFNIGGTKMNVEFEFSDKDQWFHLERDKAKKIRDL